MRRQVTDAFVLAVAAVVIAADWLATSAVAHGPCRCLDPPVSEAGGRVRIASEVGIGQARDVYPAYRVVFNPRPRDLGIAPRYLASAYRADVPTTGAVKERGTRGQVGPGSVALRGVVRQAVPSGSAGVSLIARRLVMLSVMSP